MSLIIVACTCDFVITSRNHSIFLNEAIMAYATFALMRGGVPVEVHVLAALATTDATESANATLMTSVVLLQGDHHRD